MLHFVSVTKGAKAGYENFFVCLCVAFSFVPFVVNLNIFTTIHHEQF